ncbi:MAG: rnfH [Solimicrobium sp.]|jgi:putative ubiquitin-RnfH superfamily antitoxin RatB of RatAB toxin-antitoxin module|nr:rnfH [Solimicrobium sp.]
MKKNKITVCFLTPGKQFLRTLQVSQGATIQQAIMLSGLIEAFPEIILAHLKMGIYSKLSSPDTVLRDLDRVEIYRPLEVDPMAARRRRAEKASK